MKKLLALLVVGGLLALTTGCPPGSTTGPEKPKDKDKTTTGGGDTTTKAPEPTKGELKGVDAAGKKIDVGEKKGIEIPESAKITVNGEKAALADLKAAATTTAKVTYDEKGKVTEVAVVAAAAPPLVTPTKVAGKAKSAAKDKVTVTDKDGKDVDLAVTGDTAVTIDGKAGKAEDIKKDSDVAATKEGDKVTKIDATSPAAPMPMPVTPTKVEGKAKSAAKDKVTVTDKDGKDVDLAVTGDTKVTIDGKADSKAEDIKKDSMVTATKDGDKVIKIDATSPK